MTAEDGRRRRARRLFLLVCAVALVSIAAYVTVTSPAFRRSKSAAPSARHEMIASVPDGPVILFRDASPGDVYGRIALLHLPLSEQPRLVSPLSCERVHYASGAGVCMVTDEARLPVRHLAYTFDRAFARHHTISLTGAPIRARVSPDGRRAALTVFETGHSYADEAFSTKTIIIDMSSGRTLADLEDFAVQKDGAPFKSVDFNFWGVTFREDGDGFYATLKTGKERYLVSGSVDARQAMVVRAGVECPSLSPDGKLIVFKKPLTGEIGWRLHVLDLAAGTEHPLNQVRRSVDDQVDWFDDTHVVYHDSASEGTGIWILSIDGTTPPRLIVPNAYSPAVQR